MALRSILGALAAAGLLAAAPAVAQSPARPTPSLFLSGGCTDAACTRGRWLGFLKDHGEAELARGPDLQVRLIVLNADACAGRKDTVDIQRFVLGAARKEDRLLCGARSTPTLSAAQAQTLTKLLADPETARIEGEFPVYCSDADDGRTVEIHLLEILDAGRYRLITWDCEAPGPLRPLAAWFDDERSRLP